MNYEKVYPKESIKHLVCFFWNFEADFDAASSYQHSSVASIYPKLAFQYIPGMKISKNHEVINLFNSGFQSQTDTFCQLSAEQKVGIFGIYFQPYAIPFLFGLPTFEITNQNIEIAELLGKDGVFLEEKVLNCVNTQERVAVMTEYLEQRINKFSTRLEDTIAAIQHIVFHKGSTKMIEVLGRQFLSQRQFERNFKLLTGFSPKNFSRIVRFEKSIENAINQDLSLTEVALQAGYFDQSHMIREFRAFTGKNPVAYFSEDLSLFVKE